MKPTKRIVLRIVAASCGACEPLGPLDMVAEPPEDATRPDAAAIFPEGGLDAGVTGGGTGAFGGDGTGSTGGGDNTTGAIGGTTPGTSGGGP